MNWCNSNICWHWTTECISDATSLFLKRFRIVGKHSLCFFCCFFSLYASPVTPANMLKIRFHREKVEIQAPRFLFVTCSWPAMWPPASQRHTAFTFALHTAVGRWHRHPSHCIWKYTFEGHDILYLEFLDINDHFFENKSSFQLLFLALRAKNR